MTEEEKKAIETIKGLQIYYDDYCLLNEEEIEENENVNNSIDLIVNLVKKQQEEIDRLLKDNRELGNRINELTDEYHKIYPPAKVVE